MLKLISTHLEGYKGTALKAPIAMLFETILQLLLPLVMAEIVDTAIPSGNINEIFRLGLIMLVMSVASLLCGALSGRFSTYAAQGFGANLRQAMFDKIQTFSFADIDRFSSASLITRLTNDVNTITMMLSMGLRMLVRAPVMLIMAFALTVSINARLSLILLAAIPVMMLAVGIIMKICSKLFNVVQQKVDAVNGTLQENLVAIRVVKAFVREDYERAKFKKSNDDLRDAFLNVGMKITAIMPVMMICMYGVNLMVLYSGGRMVMVGSFLLGDLQAVLSYISQILMSIMMVAMIFLQLSRAQACVRRIQEVLDTEPDIENKPNSHETQLPAPKGEVEFRDVSFRYTSGTGEDVLSHLNFSVKPGQFVAIVGGTGTGKSSLVNLIPRFYDVSGGAVLLDGVDVRDYPLEELRGRIGMVLQNNVLFSGTIRENLLWGRPDATEEEMIRAAKDAQAYDFIMSFPDGFDTHIDQGGVNVSGGQKQRLCIARAMLRKPSVIIMDDSTSAVDSATEAAIRESFQTNLADTTVIIIAQRISSVEHADEILVLDDGKIAGQGTHEELLAGNAIYQEIYQSQQEGVSE